MDKKTAWKIIKSRARFHLCDKAAKCEACDELMTALGFIERELKGFNPDKWWFEMTKNEKIGKAICGVGCIMIFITHPVVTIGAGLLLVGAGVISKE